MDKTNYRPISILPLISKLFEKVICQQLSEYIEKYLSMMLCGFRKAHSTQHALFKLLQSWQHERDNNGYIGTLLMDLSKAYDCLPHDLIIAKLEAYGLSRSSLNLMYNYLSGRKQRTRIGSTFSSWFVITRGVPQGSILGPLLFNIFINDLFFELSKTEICNFADDNTIYDCGSSLQTIVANLEHDACNLLQWFKINSLKANPNKFQFMILGKNVTETFSLNVNETTIEASSNVVLLGVTIDQQLNFKLHVDNLCRHAMYKVYALRRIRKYLNVTKAKNLSQSFIHSQFIYAPLIWMFCGKESISKIHKIHHRSLKIVYNSYDQTYEEILTMSNVTSIHQKHLQFLAIEVFKSIMKLNPEFMWSFFNINHVPYSLRAGTLLALPPANTTRYGINSLRFRGSYLWNSLPSMVKNSSTLLQFKNNLKALGILKCTCSTCRT